MKELSKQDIWALILGAAAIATGGGGSAPSYEQFSAAIDPVFNEGHTPKLIDPKELKNDDLIFMDVGCGGGIEREYQEKYMRYLPQDAWQKQYELVYPINSWSEYVNMRKSEGHLKALEELVGGEPMAYLGFEVGPLDAGQLLDAAKRGLPLLDADCAGYRSVPELSLTKLNVIDAPITPYTIGTSWGDLIIGKKVLSHQRWEDICRAVATRSGGGWKRGLWVTEGFGELKMSDRSFNLFKKLEGKQAAINGMTQIRAGVIRPEIIVPLDFDSDSEEDADDLLSEGMTAGTPLRIIAEPYFGEIGELLNLPVQLQSVETGSLVRVLDVMLKNGKKVTVPRANVEIIEE